MAIRDLEPKLLRTFCAVADELHFRRAAARLNATQSSISQQVQELERRIGVNLFTRNRRSVELTEGGKVLHQEARDLLARAEASVIRVRDAARGLRGTLTCGLIGAATFEAMPLLMREVRQLAPDVRFRFREMTAKEQIAALHEGAIDAGLVRAEVRAAGLELRTFWTEPVVCLLPEGHSLAHQKAVAVKDLENEPVLNLSRIYDPAAHDFYLGVYRAAGFEPMIVHEVSQIATILFVIATERCVALGPAGWRVLSRDGVVLRPLAPPVPQVSTRLIWNPERVSRALQVTLDAADALRTRMIASAPQLS
jgi:DNA-binding transcriptional LysR family regulator